MKRSDDTLTAADMTPAERAAWKVAVGRGLNISRADLRALLEAAKPRAHESGDLADWYASMGDDSA